MLSSHLVVGGYSSLAAAVAQVLGTMTDSRVVHASSLKSKDLQDNDEAVYELRGGAVCIWVAAQASQDLVRDMADSRILGDWWGAAVFLGTSAIQECIIRPCKDLGLRTGPGSPLDHVATPLKLGLLLGRLHMASEGRSFQSPHEFRQCVRGGAHLQLEEKLRRWLLTGEDADLDSALALSGQVSPYLYDAHRYRRALASLEAGTQTRSQVGAELAHIILGTEE